MLANSALNVATPTAPQVMSEYWIGIDGIAPDEALRAQLEIPAGQGLLINQVVDDSPASRAGLKAYDVLLTCQELPIAEVPDLAKILTDKKESVLTLRLIRGAKRILIEVKPERRPASQTGETCPAVSKVPDELFARRVWLDLVGLPPSAEEIQRFVADKNEKKRDQLVNRLLRRPTLATKSCAACHVNDGDAIQNWNAWVSLPHRLALQATWHSADQNAGLAPDKADGTAGGWHVLMDSVNLIRGVNGQSLADDVTVSLSRKGKNASQVVVRKGDVIYEIANVEQLQKLPDEVKSELTKFIQTLNADWFAAPATGSVGVWDLNAVRHLAADRYFLGTNAILFDATGTATIGNASIAPLVANKASTEEVKSPVDAQIEALAAQLAQLQRTLDELKKSVKTESAKPEGGAKK